MTTSRSSSTAATARSRGNRTWATAGDDEGYALALDKAGNAFVTGAGGAGGAKTIKFAAATGGVADGTVLWSKSFDGGADHFVYQAAVDAGGNAIVAVYAASDGAVLGQYSSIATAPCAFTDGSAMLYLVDGATIVSQAALRAPGSGWSLWSSSDGSVSVWLMNGTTQASRGAVEPAGSAWSVLH